MRNERWDNYIDWRRFASKLGVESKLDGWGDEEISGLSVEAAVAIGIPNPAAARLAAYIRYIHPCDASILQTQNRHHIRLTMMCDIPHQ